MAQWNDKNQIIKRLRQVWFMHPVRKQAEDKAKKSYQVNKADGTPSKRPSVFYICAGCGDEFKKMIKKKLQIYVDHIVPVVDLELGFIDWNTYISRLFTTVDNLQVLCKKCHDEKTSKERSLRCKYRHARKLQQTEQIENHVKNNNTL